MRRREFIIVISGAAMWPLVARAQPRGKRYRVGFLHLASGPDPRQSGAFERGLQELGYVTGQNVDIEYRWAAGRMDQLPALARELVQLPCDVILVAATPVVQAVRNATKTIPIVIAHSADPVQTGFVASLAHPGGNITGLSLLATELAPKRIELLRELLPRMRSIGFLAHGADPAHRLFISETQTAAERYGLRLFPTIVRGPDEFARAFADVVREHCDVMAVQPIFLQTPSQTRQIIDLALTHRLPSISDYWEEFAVQGGLMSFGASRADLYRRAATYVDKILKGASPADLPIEQPTRFEFGINLKTAKALGLDVPAALLARADEVIE